MYSTCDSDLLENFKEGNVQAFEQVFKLYYKLLKTEAFLLLDDEKDAEDILQQLFLDIWNKQLYRNIDVSVKAYLHTAVRNKCLNFLEKKKHYDQLVTQYSESLPPDTGNETSEAESLPAYINNALKELPPQRLAAFHLVHMEEKSYKDAADEMGISVNSLKTHLKMGVKFLRNTLEKAY